MRSASLVIIVLLSIGLTGGSCKKIRELTRFNINNISYATIPSGGIINLPFPIYSPDIQTNSAQEFETNKTEAKLVRAAFLRGLTLAIHTPEQANFDFLRSVEIFISAPNQAEKRIASKNDIPQTGLKLLNVETDATIDLKEYVKGERYSLRIQAVTRQLPGSDVTLRINSTFEVEANIF